MAATRDTCGGVSNRCHYHTHRSLQNVVIAKMPHMWRNRKRLPIRPIQSRNQTGRNRLRCVRIDNRIVRTKRRNCIGSVARRYADSVFGRGCKMKPMPTTTIFSRKQCEQLIAKTAKCKTLNSAADIVEQTAHGLKSYTMVDRNDGSGKKRRRRNNWKRDLLALARALRSRTPEFGVFTKGNSKLPFFSFYFD